MLFSQKSVADFINQSFEAVWESVRPVPIVRIDFGNGKILTRTLHGNILTSICTPDGFVIDAVPGIYTETAYLLQLRMLQVFAKIILSLPAAERQDKIIAFHRVLDNAALALSKEKREDLGKFTIEKPIKQIVGQPKNAKPTDTKSAAKRPPNVAEDVAGWKELAEDTRLNEQTRRRQIHELLARPGLVKPEHVTRTIYKEVLHADLDDPYLGLGEVLFAKYPFAKEDASR